MSDRKQEFLHELHTAHTQASKCPPPKMVIAFFDELLGLLFPEYASTRYTDRVKLEAQYDFLKKEFRGILDINSDCLRSQEPGVVDRIFENLPSIRKKLMLDIEAICQGDPAARNTSEVIRSYPGFYAIATYRFANHLLNLGIRLIPRILSENAHRRTGIDIHPGASIGDHFCIDHGTGIVIGETTEIGSHVKIYQGVTLGALSVNKEDAKKKRHPTIGDRVVLYANATILGGETVIGEKSVIGGNVWLTRSVPAGSRIYYQAKMTNSDGDMDLITIK